MTLEPTSQPAAGAFVTHTDHLLDALRRGVAQADLLTACRQTPSVAAVLLVLAGVVFLLWGYYAFKALVLLNAAAAGAWAGYLVGRPSDAALPGALVGAFVAAAVAWPLMKYAVAVTGGVLGMVIGMTAWRAAGLDADYAAAGGGMGLIFFGMLSFILFRTSVMLFTSLQGAAMLAFGLLGLLYHSRALDASAIDAKLLVMPSVMPLAIGVAAVIGLLYQNNDTAAPAPVAAE